MQKLLQELHCIMTIEEIEGYIERIEGALSQPDTPKDLCFQLNERLIVVRAYLLWREAGVQQLKSSHRR